jgi:cytochrome c oxidase accessory protein FixG
MSEQIPAYNIPAKNQLSANKLHAQKPTPAQLGGTIYTRSFVGIFRRLRINIAGALAILFFGTAWINWNGHQAVLWDLSERKFYVFGATFWPQDFSLLAFAMIIAAFLLLAVTVFMGRVWCGYACPQSTWTWAYMWMEKITEGDSYQRVKLDAAPWSANKLIRKVSKHTLWSLAALATGIAFMGYFMPVRQLVIDLFNAQLDIDYLFWVLFTAACTYLNAGWVREKVCTHMCPYARFQSVMFDKDTLIVAYDAARGEGRGSRKKDEDYKAQGLGDCIDCYMCVQVCPTGIDIRDGLQMDCIGCAACVDACDSIMDKMGYAQGLISYTSEHELAGEKRVIWRPSLIGYLIAVVVIIAALVFSLQEREQMSMGVYRDRSLYHSNSAGEIVNVYRLKITNKTQATHSYQITLDDTNILYLPKQYKVELAAGERLDLPVAISMKRNANTKDSEGFIDFNFKMINLDTPNESILQAGTFIHPSK